MTCLSVRERLTEHALGTLAIRDAAVVDRHLQWCAACRKESGELDRAGATLAFSVAPAEPDAGLQDRVVNAVQAAAGRRHAIPKHGRLAIAAMVAAMVAISGLGWGAVMAGRAARSQAAADAAARQTEMAGDTFQRLIKRLPFRDPSDEALVGRLVPTSGTGGGSAITLVSPSIQDMAVVIVNGLPPAAKGTLPYTVRLRDTHGNAIVVGRIKALDASGGGQVARDDVARDLSGYGRVLVVDAKGQVVLSGSLATRADLASPGP